MDGKKLKKNITSCVQPHQLGCQRDTARRISAERRAAAPLLLCATVDRYVLLAGAQQQTSRTPQRLSSDGADGQTNGHPTVT